MGSLTLLAEARAAGLTIRADGGQLRIRGPKAAGELVRRLLEAKPAVLAALEAEGQPGDSEARPTTTDDIPSTCRPAPPAVEAPGQSLIAEEIVDWESTRPADGDTAALASWWLARYVAAGVSPPVEMVTAAGYFRASKVRFGGRP